MELHLRPETIIWIFGAFLVDRYSCKAVSYSFYMFEQMQHNFQIKFVYNFILEERVLHKTL